MEKNNIGREREREKKKERKTLLIVVIRLSAQHRSDKFLARIYLFIYLGWLFTEIQQCI